jgi:glyoxylase-like metal-dependent hydrolase (beta-lactamase superfamily II)
MLQIKCFTFGPFETNCYVVSDDHHVLLIDPACSNAYEQQLLVNYIQPLTANRSPLTIIATHGHLDHLWGAKWATETWHTPVLMHEADIPMAKAMQAQYNLFGIRATAESFPIEPLADSLSPFALIPTPGHTPGSVCLYFPHSLNPNSITPSILFSGDTLFQMGYGRTDLPGGNMGQLIDSLERLFELPSDVVVYPGHGDSTTIGAEKR